MISRIGGIHIGLEQTEWRDVQIYSVPEDLYNLPQLYGTIWD